MRLNSSGTSLGSCLGFFFSSSFFIQNKNPKKYSVKFSRSETKFRDKFLRQDPRQLFLILIRFTSLWCLFLEQYKRSLSQVLSIIFNEIYRRVTRSLVRIYIFIICFYTMYAVKVGNSSGIFSRILSRTCLGSSFFIQNKNPQKIVWKISEKILKKKIRDKSETNSERSETTFFDIRLNIKRNY